MAARKSRREPAQLSAFRLPPELLARVDAYAQRLQEQTPWATVTRSDAVRALLAQALDAVDGKSLTRRLR
jgi:hypothetical protein